MSIFAYHPSTLLQKRKRFYIFFTYPSLPLLSHKLQEVEVTVTFQLSYWTGLSRPMLGQFQQNPSIGCVIFPFFFKNNCSYYQRGWLRAWDQTILCISLNLIKHDINNDKIKSTSTIQPRMLFIIYTQPISGSSISPNYFIVWRSFYGENSLISSFIVVFTTLTTNLEGH